MPPDLEMPKTPWSPPPESEPRSPFEQPPLHSKPRAVMLSIPRVRLKPSRRILSCTHGATNWVAPEYGVLDAHRATRPVDPENTSLPYTNAGFNKDYPEFEGGETLTGNTAGEAMQDFRPLATGYCH